MRHDSHCLNESTHLSWFLKRVIMYKKHIKNSLLFDWEWQREVAEWIKCHRDLNQQSDYALRYITLMNP